VPGKEKASPWDNLEFKRSSGRVARQRSAKPCTAVRIRSRPPDFILIKENKAHYHGSNKIKKKRQIQ
jgi:hypothetical protein